jgi:hypothetical protein
MKDRLGPLRLRFAELRLARDGDRVQVYAGKDFSGYEVSVAVLTERAATEPGLREAFAAAAGRARAASPSSTQSDAHAAVPWLAARHPGGAAVIQRLSAELDRHRPAMPAGSITLAPLPIDVPPPPVWPDATLAPMPPPIDLRPAAATSPLAPIPPPPAAPKPAPAKPVPAQRGARVPPAPAAPAARAKRQLTPATIGTLVTIAVTLIVCCNAVLPNLLR